MQNLYLPRDYQKEVRGREKQRPDLTPIEYTISEDTTIFAPDRKSIVAKFLFRSMSPMHCIAAFEDWYPAVNQLPINRPKPAGFTSVSRKIRKPVLDALKKRAGRYDMLGFAAGTDTETCRKTALTKAHPELLESHRELIEHADKLYAKHMPHLYAFQRAVIDKVPSCRLWQTAFSTIYLGKNFATRPHTDTGNLRGAMSVLLPLGEFTGGALILPRYRIAIAYRMGDALLLNPQEVHGNALFEGSRLCAVLYCGGWAVEAGY